MPGFAIRISASDNAEAINLRAYWSVASAMTGRASFAELAKNLWPPGIAAERLGRAGRPDPRCSAANGGDVPIATIGFQARLVDVAP